jgi:hypothetical protein
MNLTSVFSTLAIFAVLYLAYRASKRRRGQDVPRDLAGGQSASPSLHMIDETQFASLIANEPHHVLFHVHPPDTGSIHSMGITVQELEKCLPWVPGETKVVIVSKDGFAPSLLADLRGLHIRRDLFLVQRVS